jgi:CHASE3 domain sensor protein
MTRLPFRLTLLLACVAAIGYVAFLTWSSERDARLIDTSSRQFTTAARAISSSVAELRSAQQSYVAVGQGEDFWFARVTAIVADLRDRLAALKSLAATPEAVVAVDTASGALQDFEQMDRRARDYARNRELALASDLVFTDGFDLTKKTGESIERAVTAELTSRDALVGGLRRQEAIALAGAAGIAVLGLLLLLPRGRTREVVDRAAPAVAAQIATASLQALDDLQDTPAMPAPAALPVLPVLPAPSAVDLAGVAALCVELARIQETRALPRLLERAAGILHANGIVLWIADPDGRELSPIVVHGYSPQLANRFGTIARDAGNVTALAYRTGLLQTMKSDAVSNGAVAAPLVTGTGCVGVMAAEMKDGGEQQEPLLAAASIFASQLATLVGPPSARSKTEAAG